MTKCDLGCRIVVLDRGWVLVGEVTDHGDHLHITDARCIRRWGTTKGLGQLRGGPLATTEVEAIGQVDVPIRAVIFILEVEAEPWTSKP